MFLSLFNYVILILSISDCSKVKDLFVYLCKMLGVNLMMLKDSDSPTEESGIPGDVLEVLGLLLGTTYELDVYDKSHDPVYRLLIQVLLVSDRYNIY